jgi:hypothetical protein
MPSTIMLMCSLFSVFFTIILLSPASTNILNNEIYWILHMSVYKQLYIVVYGYIYVWFECPSSAVWVWGEFEKDSGFVHLNWNIRCGQDVLIPQALTWLYLSV